MAKLNFNTTNIKRVPINRNNIFYSDESFAFEGSIGKNYIEQDMNQTAVLYQVDASISNINDTYGETRTDGVQFKTPVEFHCVYKVEQPELKAYDKNKNIGTYMKTGKLTIGVYEETLKELGIDIKKGDYIGIQITPEHMEYWSVANDGKNNYDNAHTLFGVRPLYRTVQCYPVDTSEFQAMKIHINENQLIKLTESLENLDSPLYHYTFLEFLLGMLESGKFETSFYDTDYYRAEHGKNGWLSISGERNRSYISFTRDKRYNVNLDKVYGINQKYLGPQVRITFSPNFFKSIRNATLQPYYFYSYPDQKEEKLFFNKRTESIPFDTRYVEKIDLLFQTVQKRDVEMLKHLFDFPEIINKTFVYYCKYATNQFSIDRVKDETLKKDDYVLYSKFLNGDENYATPLIYLKNVLHYFDDDELNNYNTPSKIDFYYNGHVKDENEKWELEMKRKKITDKIIKLYDEVSPEAKKEIRKEYNKVKDKLSEPYEYEAGGMYRDDPVRTYYDDTRYLKDFLSFVNRIWYKENKTKEDNNLLTYNNLFGSSYKYD